MAVYKRVLLKISGEALSGPLPFGLHPSTVRRICEDVAHAVRSGCQVCLVVGGGNIFRGVGRGSEGIERTTADQVGMLATVMNALVLGDVFTNIGIYASVFSGVFMPGVCEVFTRKRALRHLEDGAVVIFGGGLGSPFFTTDTTAALRSSEMACEALFKGTRVDGVYSSDPAIDKTAVRYDHLTYDQVLRDDLQVMDGTAISMARANKMPIIVFSLESPDSFSLVLKGGGCFSKIAS
ncbi:MAG: UMP kinase [Alphaproteobacteria bacterium]|nr:UMP kinase [Alphaproteobacteria bacterium]